MSTPLIMTEEGRAALRAVRERAAAAPVDMSTLADRLATPDGKAAHVEHMTAQTVSLPLAFLVTFSIETGHPVGTCRHMSMSVQPEGRLPNPHALWMIAEELGFVGGLESCTIWRETLQVHGEAINVVQPISVAAGATRA